MPSVYTSRIPNVIQFNNESDPTSRVQTNTSVKTTTQAAYRTLTTYITSTPPSNRLSTAAIVFIVLCVIIGFIILCAAIFYIYRRWKRRQPPPKPTVPKPIVPPVIPAGRFARSPVNSVAQPPGGAPPRKAPAVLPSLFCLQPLCREYLRQLHLKEAYLDNRYDKCFCRKCHDTSGIKSKCGHWCTQLHDWNRFGLSVSQAHQKTWNIFREWKTSYYGTSPDLVASILNNRFLPLDGDQLGDKTTFKSGHPDRTHCITSPSLVCASRPKFCARARFTASNGTTYNVQVVLECKQKPDTYTVQGNGTGFNNIEWATVARSTLIPCGLLIRLQKERV